MTDLVITGEGRFDSQSDLEVKAPMGVIDFCKKDISAVSLSLQVVQRNDEIL